MNKTKKRDFSLLYFLILIPFFKTDYFYYIFPKINSIINILRICSIGFIFITIIKKNYLSKKFLLIVLFSANIILSTFFHSGDMVTALNYFLGFISLAYLIDYFKKNLKFISTLLFCFELVIYINFITMIVYPNGMYSTGTIMTGIASLNWFLGFKNVMITYFLPAFIISYLYMNISGKKARTILLSIIIFISSIISGSATTIVGIILLFSFTFFEFLKKNYKIFNIKTYIKTYIIIFFSIVIFRLQYLFSFILVDILHKDLTLTHRTELWDITLKKIMEYPIFGHGWEYLESRQIMYNSQTIITAHNQILEYLYIGGFLSIIILVILYFTSRNEIKEHFNDKNIQMISIGFFIFLIINLTEVYLNPLIMIVLFLFIYSKNYIDEGDKKNEKSQKN